MQQENVAGNGDQQDEPDWVLASYGQRMGAWALDFVGFTLPLILLIIGSVLLVFGLILSTELVEDVISTPSDYSGVEGTLIELAKQANRILVTIAAFAGVLAIIIIGYIVWWLIALGRGQTPGKQIVGIRVIKDDGSPSNWGYTFLREFVIKFLLLGFISEATLGIARLVDYLWPLWDRAEMMQTLHDKMLGTIVVRNR